MEEWISMRDLREHFDWSRQFVSFIALRERWTKIPGSRPRYYLASDVADFEISRLHSDLARANGVIFRGLIRHVIGFSDICPVCKEQK